MNDEIVKIIDNVHTGAMTHERGSIIDMQADMLRARRRMLWNGSVTASLVLNRTGNICMVPTISQTGLGEGEKADDYIAAASLAVEDAVEQLGKSARKNDASVEEVAGQAVRRVARSMFGLRPITHVHIMRVNQEDLMA